MTQDEGDHDAHTEMSPTFDLKGFIGDCLEASREPSPQAAVRQVVARAVSRPAAVEAVLGRKLGSDFGILHYSPQLTVQHVIFPPGYRTGLHDHLLWAVIGIWGGYEDNAEYRLNGNQTLTGLGTRRCEVGDVISLPAEAIHEVFAPSTVPSAGLHVYGGALFDQPRREWVGDPPTARPVDDSAILTCYLDALGAADLVC
jgi:predicted metal-dependent enzyme (double-stranded beta helix superfamily)